jgi:hypothetical protein
MQKAGNDAQKTKGDATYGFFPLWNPPSSLRRSELTSRMHEVLVTHRPARRKGNGNTTTVLAGKGTLRRAKPRRALAHCAPLWALSSATGGSGGITRQAPMSAFGRQAEPKQRMCRPTAD